MTNTFRRNKLNRWLLRGLLLFLLSTIAIGWIYRFSKESDTGGVIVFFLFATVSILAGAIGGLLGGIVVRYSALRSAARAQQLTFTFVFKNIAFIAYWSVVGGLTGLDIFCIMIIAFVIITSIAATWGLAAIPILIILLVLLFFNPLTLLIFVALPASVSFFLVIFTEKAPNGLSVFGMTKHSFAGYRLAIAIPVTLFICYLSFNVINLLDRTYVDDSEYVTEYIEASWRKLPQPPSEISRLVAAYPFEIYIETTNGNIWGCKRPSKFDVNCWFHAEEIPEPLQLPCTEQDDRLSGITEIAPGFPENITISKSISVHYCEFVGRDDRERSEFQYVLTTDGEIWQWGYDELGLVETSKLDQIFRNIYTSGVLAFFLTWAIGMVLLWTFKVRRQENE